MNIVYLIFGNEITYYQQVFFSIYTVLANKEETDRVVILTEEPCYFKQLNDLITIIPIDKEVINDWKGEYKYLFRAKIKALGLVIKMYPHEHILYLDGDTFVYKPLKPLRENLDRDQSIMHINEGRLNELSTKSEKKMWRAINGNIFANVAVDDKVCMWNAGVIGISKNNHEVISLVLQICDEMCSARVAYFTKEQLAFSIALGHMSTLIPSDDIIGHYWGNKTQWNVVISNWINRSFMNNLCIQEMIDNIKVFPFGSTPYYVRQSNTRVRLTKKIDNLFRTKESLYIKE